MALSLRTTRIVVAALIALVMVGGSYALSGPIPFIGSTRVADASVAAELLRSYAAKDSDTDGLPDWQEALYGTDPQNPESVKAGVTDGDAVAQGLVEPKVSVRTDDTSVDPVSVPGVSAGPATLTDQFARELFKQYLSTRGETAPTTDDIVSFVEVGVQNLNNSHASPDTFMVADIVSNGATGPQAMRTYAIAAENVLLQNTVTTDDTALMYFSQAMNGDKTAYKRLEAVGDAYRITAKRLMAMPVPKEAVPAHLAIANALVHMSEISEDMATVNEDPLRALMGIGLYDPYAQNLAAGFLQLNNVFVAENVTFTAGQAGYEFYSIGALAGQLSSVGTE